MQQVLNGSGRSSATGVGRWFAAHPWPLGRGALVTLLVGLALLIGLIAATVYTVGEFVVANRWVDHAYTIASHLDAVVALTSDAETGQRGYLLTGDTDYLAPYTRAVPAIADDLARLRALTIDTPDQQARLAELERLVRARLAELEATIRLREQDGLPAAVRAIRTDQGRAWMDSIRAVAREMQATEQALLAARSAAAATALRTTLVLGGLAMVLVAGLAVTASITITSASARARLYAAERRARALAEAEHARRAFLAEAGQVLVTSLDQATTLRSVASLVVPILADYCLVDIIADDGAIERVAAAAADPAQADLVAGLRRYPPAAESSSAIPTVLRTGRPILTPTLSPAYVATTARDEGHLRLLQALGPRASLVVPLRARGRILGALSFVATTEQRRYDREDLALAEELATHAALALDNARLYGDAQAALAARDIFLSVASHELKTPVTVLKGLAQVLLRQQARGPLPRELLDRSLRQIDRSASRLVGLTDDLLSVARLRLDHLPMRPATLDLAALVVEVATRQADLLAERYDLRIEAPATPCFVVGDAMRLEQVVTNLLDNAAKYSPGGGVIRVAVGAAAEGVLLTVRDAGIGLPPDSAEAIFSPFSRARNALDRHVPGWGLGLYICRMIAERHEGRLWAESPGEGQGTTFSLWLPGA